MANPNFSPTYSTNEIWRDTSRNRCLTDDLDAIESDIETLETGKADADHTHTGYAAANHSHSYNDLTGRPTIHPHEGLSADGCCRLRQEDGHYWCLQVQGFCRQRWRATHHKRCGGRRV